MKVDPSLPNFFVKPKRYDVSHVPSKAQTVKDPAQDKYSIFPPPPGMERTVMVREPPSRK
jgi:hypothetical protein